LSAVLGASVTPSFFLLQLGTAIGLTVASHDRSHRLGLGLATLLTAFLYYLPCVYFYLITPHQLGPVSKHVSRIAYAIPALLTGIGRGKLPEGEDKLQWIGFAISAVVTVLVVSTIVKNMKSSGPAVKALWITFLTPFVVLLGGAVLSLIPSLSFLRIGTDRCLAVFVPSGALLTGAAAEKFASRLLPYLIGIVLVMMKMVALPSANEAKEGRVFRQEVQSLCSQEQLLDVPLIACPPEIVPGIELYCPRLSPSTTFGINSLDMPSLEKCVENATSVGKLLVIYYRAHVPQVLAKCKDRFSTVTLLSKRVYGGSKDPIFAIFLFEDAVPANRR
ncbi:MAG: hypothetical protein N2Z21_10020, partial [Candidatus Sumerlaeaceae bacterium]|nr:hypothetical protein [Candidatus Sumerlaeaceae bacterium]